MNQDAYSQIMSLPNGKKYFGTVLIKDILLNNIFEEDASDILYFAGRDLARSFSSNTLLGVQEFFDNANWGDLKMNKQEATKQTWELSGEAIAARYAAVEQPNFYMEAGFIAQQIQQQLGKHTDATYELNKNNSVIFTLLIDD